MIPLIRPDISFDEVASDLREVFDSGMLTRGPKVAQFEQEFARRLGVRFALSTTSATTALHLVLAARGVGPGDEVLVADFTFPATGNVVAQTGATPVLVDCLPGRFDMSPDDAARKITPRTRGIIPVDPFGQPAELGLIMNLARAAGLFVLEDAACAIGARRDAMECGAFGEATGCFSFHPRKILTTGEGGMVTTNDEALAERMALLRNHGGQACDGAIQFVTNGFNYRMSEIQAVLGLRQLDRLDAILADRRATAASYMTLLAAALPEVAVPLSASVESCTFQSFVVVLPAEVDRAAVIAFMRSAGIETTLGTYAMHAQPAFTRWGYSPGDLPHSFAMQERTLTLPLLPRMGADLVARVVETLAQAVSACRR